MYGWVALRAGLNYYEGSRSRVLLEAEFLGGFYGEGIGARRVAGIADGGFAGADIEYGVLLFH